nr:MAG TPA: hypothetical protein [Caudoviricetes sp.]
MIINTNMMAGGIYAYHKMCGCSAKVPLIHKK